MTKSPFIQVTETYGRLTAMEDALRSCDKIRFYCICGNEKYIRAGRVKQGMTRSCGCLHIEVVTATIREVHKRQSHVSRHPLYNAWKGMIARTTNTKHKSYKRYGGRGIQVCDRWRDAQTFYEDIEAAIGSRPEGMTLDRINVNGNYEPGNVRWATALMQAANKQDTNYESVVAFIRTWQHTMVILPPP